jgi:Nucleoside 2-deoxyribosyltransferase like
MADVFLMGTAGKMDDPKRSLWREPIKAACVKHGVTFFDPVVPEWNQDAMRNEVEALRVARVIVMAITADTAGIASLAESGWAALSALQRKQAFGLYVDTAFKEFNPRMSQESSNLIDFLFGKGREKSTAELIEASRRARQLVGGHAKELAAQFPDLNLYIARSLDDLAEWTVATAQKLGQAPTPQRPT